MIQKKYPELLEKTRQFVSNYFSSRSESTEEGSLYISGDRYVLMRAASLSTEFYSIVRELYGDEDPYSAERVAADLLFDLSHSTGKADAEY